MKIVHSSTLVLAILVVLFSVHVSAQAPPCVLPKVVSQPRSDPYGHRGPHQVTRSALPHPDSNVPGPVSVFIPGNASSASRAPVIFFAHGFGGFDYLYYAELLERVASNGYVVVF